MNYGDFGAKRWKLQPVRLCKNGCILGRVAPAYRTE